MGTGRAPPNGVGLGLFTITHKPPPPDFAQLFLCILEMPRPPPCPPSRGPLLWPCATATSDHRLFAPVLSLLLYNGWLTPGTPRRLDASTLLRIDFVNIRCAALYTYLPILASRLQASRPLGSSCTGLDLHLASSSLQPAARQIRGTACPSFPSRIVVLRTTQRRCRPPQTWRM